MNQQQGQDISGRDAWATRAPELAQWAWDRLVNRTDVWGGYHSIADRKKEIKKNGGIVGPLGATTTRPAKSKRNQVFLTVKDLEQHFRATDPRHVVGLHTTAPDDTSRWGAAEIDHHGDTGTSPEINFTAAKAWFKRLRDLGFTPLLTDSNGKGGYHLRVIFSGPTKTPLVFSFLEWLIADHATLEMPTAPETFPKQASLGKTPCGNWLRIPGLHHTRAHWARVWDGDKWLDDAEAVTYILAIKGDSPDLIPVIPQPAKTQVVRPVTRRPGGYNGAGIEKRVRAYLDKMPSGKAEGTNRDGDAYRFACFLVRDLAIPDAEALLWLFEWDGRQAAQKGDGELKRILASAHAYGQRATGCGLESPAYEPKPTSAGGSRRDSGHEEAAGEPSDTDEPDPNHGDDHELSDSEVPVDADPSIDDTGVKVAQPDDDGLECDDDPHRLARLLIQKRVVPRGLTLRYHQDQYLSWEGKAYRPLLDQELRGDLVGIIKAEFDRIATAKRAAWSDDKKPPPHSRRVTNSVVSDATQALRSMIGLPSTVMQPSWVEPPDNIRVPAFAPPFKANEVLAANNALVHLPTMTTHAHTPAFFSSNVLDYDYCPHAPIPTSWLGFLQGNWPTDTESIQALQEWFGYCLLPDTSQQKILMIVGPRRSGKGTISRVMRELVGFKNTAGPTLAGLGTNFGLSTLLGKTLATISDARMGSKTDAAVVTERLLSISGEDALTIDRKNMSHVTAKLPVRFVILTNELPRLNDPSGAIVGRLIVLRQTQSWYGREDTALTGKLLAELPGILNWSLAGWRRLHQRGSFVQPDSGRKLIDDLHNLSSPIGEFIRERCEIAPQHEVLIRDLFAAWQIWSRNEGCKDPGTSPVFGRDLQAALPQLGVRQTTEYGKRVRVYIGIRLRQEASSAREPMEQAA